MDCRMFGLDSPLLFQLHPILDAAASEPASKSGSANNNKSPTRSYFQDAVAMAVTPADVKEYPNKYEFIIDMPGLKSGDIKVQVEDENVLMICGERKKPEEEEKDKGVKYVRQERMVAGKYMRKFALPENADVGKISAVCKDGVLTVTVEKLPPPEPKKPRTIQVNVA